MNRIMNNPDYMVEDMLKGFVKAHPDLVSATDNPRVIKNVSAPIKDKVGIVTGGGSGHKPAFIGYIGRNMRWVRCRMRHCFRMRRMRLPAC